MSLRIQVNRVLRRCYARPTSNPKDFRNTGILNTQPVPRIILRIAPTEPEAPIPRIEAPIGSPMKNIVVHVGRPDPISLPDNEYPEWMWQLVRPENFPEQVEVNPRKQLRKETKLKIKANNTLNS